MNLDEIRLHFHIFMSPELKYETFMKYHWYFFPCFFKRNVKSVSGVEDNGVYEVQNWMSCPVL